MLNSYYKGLQDDCLTIKCAHAEGGSLDDPYYLFSLDHIVGIKEETLALAGDDGEAVSYIIDTLTDAVRSGNSGLVEAFGAAGFHYFDMLMGVTNGETFYERLKTLREKYGEGYFPFVK